MSRISHLLVFALWCVYQTNGHSYNLGNCPNIKPLDDADVNKLLGRWYVIQKTNTASSCITYNITKSDEPGEFILEENSQYPAYLLKKRHHNKAIVTIPDETVPGKLKIKYPYTPISLSYTLFIADYDLYAAMFTCQEVAGFGNRQSATILSREKTLDPIYLEKIRNKLSDANVDPFDLSIVSHKGCPKSSIFSTKTVAKAIKNVAETIGDGYNYVANGVTGAVHKVTSQDASEEKPSNKEDSNTTEISQDEDANEEKPSNTTEPTWVA